MLDNNVKMLIITELDVGLGRQARNFNDLNIEFYSKNNINK